MKREPAGCDGCEYYGMSRNEVAESTADWTDVTKGFDTLRLNLLSTSFSLSISQEFANWNNGTM